MFWFVDLPDGEYSLTAELPAHGSRFGKAKAIATVARDKEGRVKIARANFTLAPTCLRGRVTDTDLKTGLRMAEVRVRGSGEYSLTDAQGAYELTRIESGKRTLVISAQGYETKNEAITLAGPGATQTLDVKLIRKRAESGNEGGPPAKS
jgi:uncharacterized membrane protein